MHAIVRRVQLEFGALNWRRLLDRMYPTAPPDSVVVVGASALAEMSRLLGRMTPSGIQRAAAAATLWKHLGAMPSAVRRPREAYLGTIIGSPEWQLWASGSFDAADSGAHCRSMIGSRAMYGWALGRLFVLRVHDAEAESAWRTMTSNIVSVLLRELSSDAHWLDEPTRTQATRKLEMMRVQISHPAWLMNTTQLAQYQQPTEPSPRNGPATPAHCCVCLRRPAASPMGKVAKGAPALRQVLRRRRGRSASVRLDRRVCSSARAAAPRALGRRRRRGGVESSADGTRCGPRG